jgi:uncharacterized protein YjiS (DUF1127 family)
MKFRVWGRRRWRPSGATLSDIQETTMTTIEFPEELAPTPGRSSFARAREALTRHFAAARKRREERLVLDELRRLDERMLRDLGIEPMDVYDALYRKRGHSVLFNPLRKPEEK